MKHQRLSTVRQHSQGRMLARLSSRGLEVISDLPELEGNRLLGADRAFSPKHNWHIPKGGDPEDSLTAEEWLSRRLGK